MEASEQAGLLERTAVEYVVQVRTDEVTDFKDTPCEIWRDIATVTVAPRTKRRTVVEKALEQARDRMSPVTADEPLVVRVLSPEDARPFKVSAVVREPELRIEGA
jgi:hypothetical protein